MRERRSPTTEHCDDVGARRTPIVSACQPPPNATPSSFSPPSRSSAQLFASIAPATATVCPRLASGQRWSIRLRRSIPRVGIRERGLEDAQLPRYARPPAGPAPPAPPRGSTSTPRRPNRWSAFHALDPPSPGASWPTVTPSAPSVPSRVFSASKGWDQPWRAPSIPT
jgi:hypothetical protein